jgi:hypothetical protein
MMGPGAYGAAGFPAGMPPGRSSDISPREIVRGLEGARRRRLVRIVSLGVLAPALLLVPAALFPEPDIATLIAVLLALVGASTAYVLNRFKLVSAASYTLLGGLMLAIAWDIANKPLYQTGLDLNDLRLYGFFLLPVLLAGVLTGRRGPILLGALAIAFTIVSLLLLKRTPELQAYWLSKYKDAPGSGYDVVAVPVVMLAVTATAAWLGADSMRRALFSAARADDLAIANERILAQAREIELARRYLQDGIAHMQQVHAAFARGYYESRAQVPEGELLPLAMSLNQLLDRMQRLLREQDQRTRVEQGAREIASALRMVRAGAPYAPPNYTGTVLDEVLVELATLRVTANISAPARPLGQQEAYGPVRFGPSPANPANPAAAPWPSTPRVPQSQIPGDPRPSPWSAGASTEGSSSATSGVPPSNAGPSSGAQQSTASDNDASAAGEFASVDARDLLPEWLRVDR